MSRLPDLPHLLWARPQAFLLLGTGDAVTLRCRLWDLKPQVQITALYWGTRFASLRDISPLLIAIDGPDDPVLDHYLASADQEHGWLLFSQANAIKVATHLRQLLFVRTSAGPEVSLRLSDAAVARAIFSGQESTETLFGPLDVLVLPDRVAGAWVQLTSGAKAQRPVPQPYVLTANQDLALNEVALRKAALRVDEHLERHFPKHAAIRYEQRWPAVLARVKEAYALRFTTQRELTSFANIFAWLDGSPLEQHREIVALLHNSSYLLPYERVTGAAELAEHWGSALDLTEPRP